MVEVYVASAFSKDGAGGNKAGVVLERPDLNAVEKMAIAKELGYSETAFVCAAEGGKTFSLEYFTPTDEVPLCGHATIASFVVLWLLGKVSAGMSILVPCIESCQLPSSSLCSSFTLCRPPASAATSGCCSRAGAGTPHKK